VHGDAVPRIENRTGSSELVVSAGVDLETVVHLTHVVLVVVVVVVVVIFLYLYVCNDALLCNKTKKIDRRSKSPRWVFLESCPVDSLLRHMAS